MVYDLPILWGVALIVLIWGFVKNAIVWRIVVLAVGAAAFGFISVLRGWAYLDPVDRLLAMWVYMGPPLGALCLVLFFRSTRPQRHKTLFR